MTWINGLNESTTDDVDKRSTADDVDKRIKFRSSAQLVVLRYQVLRIKFVYPRNSLYLVYSRN